MDVLDVHACVTEALAQGARGPRSPQLVEAVTYRFRGHSMADPEEYRYKEEVEEWRKRDPIVGFAGRLVGRGRSVRGGRGRRSTRTRSRASTRRSQFADESPFPDARLAVRRHLRDRRPGAGLVLGRRALARDPPRRARARGRQGRARPGRGGRAYAQARASPTARTRPRRPRRQAGRAMAEMRYREALEPGPARGDGARRERLPDGRGRRRLPGRVQGHRGAARGVRREARARHADLREHDRRHGRRARRWPGCGRSSRS